VVRERGVGGSKVICGGALGRMAGVCVGGVGGEVPDVGGGFVDLVAGVLFGAGPAVAEMGEPGH
jgi:hypothetical protein